MSEKSSPHGQTIEDPIAHFKSIPWCADLLADRSIIHIAVPDRRPKLDKEFTLVKESLNTKETVRACITYFCLQKRAKGAGLKLDEEKKNPFVEISCLLDIGSGVNSYASTCHGGFMATIFDEVMGTAAWQQSGDHGAYTVEMKLLFKKPLFTPAIARCVGSVVKKEGRRITVAAKIVGSDGTIHCEGEAVFLEMTSNIGKAAEAKYGRAKSKL